MAENNSTTERARALRAEKQVERLERELELIRSRLKVSNVVCSTGQCYSRNESRSQMVLLVRIHPT